MDKFRILKLASGPALLLLVVLLQPTGNPTSDKVLGIVFWMLSWWLTEVVPMAITALIPLILFPLCGIMTLEKTCLSYSNRFVFLFLGGFMLALAMEKWNLHKRIALGIVSKTGSNANRILFGFFLASYFISMWISNTATALIMLPIASSIVLLFTEQSFSNQHRGTRNFSTVMMLSIAYGASIGGMATLVGSPPNASMAGILSKSFQTDVSFFGWMKWGLPFSLVLLLLSFIVLTRWIFPNHMGEFVKGQEIIRQEMKSLGNWTRAEKWVFVLFACTACGWICQDWIAPLLKPLGIEFTDTSIALLFASLLFVIPARSKENENSTLLIWRDTEKLPWGVLIMFGGGMSLAEAFSSSGLVAKITEGMSGLQHQSPFIFVSVLCAVGLLITALMSNIAMVNIFVPVVASLALLTGNSPEHFAIPVTLAASCDYMFPMSTPPNAIAYSSGLIRSTDMLKAGLALNCLSMLLLCALVWFMFS